MGRASITDHTRARVAQLDRASAFEAEGWGFESLRACFLSESGASDSPADFDGDGIGGGDLGLMLLAWGEC